MEITCLRCGLTKTRMLLKPPGKYGVQIQESICDDCFAEWRESVPRVINHYGLNLGFLEDRQQLQTAMIQFLNLPVPEPTP